MCGISAAYGTYAPIKALYMLTKQLERGTLGTGIAYICKNQIRIIKEPIHPLRFYDKHSLELKVNSQIAIAHNRLPSKGKVTYVNTHPFMDCKGNFALVHNGHCWIEELRDYIIANGHKVYGETDSELLTHLLEELYEEYNDMIYAIEQLAHLWLNGAIAVLTKDGKIYSCRTNHNPVHYTTIRNEVYLASTYRAVKSLLETLNLKKYNIKRLQINQILEINNGKAIIHEFEKPLEPYEFHWWIYK